VGSEQATIHGVDSYWLGGSQHKRADRELARAIGARFPTVPEHARAGQDFLLRAAAWCAERGIERFTHLGTVTALPMGRNVHDAARRVNPAARVVYANRSPQAHRWAGALLSGGSRTSAVLARPGSPGDVVGAQDIAALLPAGGPACLIASQVLHFLEGGKAAEQVLAYAEALPPGSYLVASAGLLGGSPAAGELAAMYTPARIRRHTAQDVTRWLEDARLDIVPPGVADVRLIPVRAAADIGDGGPGIIAGAIARKP